LVCVWLSHHRKKKQGKRPQPLRFVLLLRLKNLREKMQLLKQWLKSRRQRDALVLQRREKLLRL
jgi:hypothetical protein